MQHFGLNIVNMSPSISLSRGDWAMLPSPVLSWVEECVALCGPRDLHIMDGSEQEARELKVNSDHDSFVLS